jgi:hypothetical protein
MWREQSLLTFVIYLFTVLVAGDVLTDSGVFSDVPTNSVNGSFLWPNKPNLVYSKGEEFFISWETSLAYITLLVYQRGISEGWEVVSRKPSRATGSTPACSRLQYSPPNRTITCGMSRI